MAKERFQSILGLRKGKAIETVATLANKALANWHMNHTFGKLGYDHLIVKQVEKKGDKFIPDEVASDKGQYAFKEFFMDAFDWDAVKERTVIGTLAQFHEVVHSSGIKNEKAVGKLQPIEIVRTDDESNDVVGARTYGVFSLDTPIPFAKVQDTLQKAIVDGLSGEEVGDYEEEEETPVVETPVVEEPVVEAPVAEEPVVEAPVAEEPVVETPVVETPAVETPVVETPAVETPVVEEPVVETPVVEEPAVETPAVVTPVVEEPVVETPVVEEPVEENNNEVIVDFNDFEDVSTPPGNNGEEISVGDIEIENFVEEQTEVPAEGATGGEADDFNIEDALAKLD
ncbi:hypothetical protein [Bacillus cereus]|uniref:hypothetical protein n=1 Tax=Bacillus cereus TaxID=1396 RepID=UPI0015D4C046|nr:hypothetical protein [Bacillus cereus]